MKRLNRASAILMVFTLLIWATSFLALASGTSESIESSTSVDSEDFNLVLLIDRSGSMKNTDRSSLVKDAARLFVDLCDETSASQIAVMSFDTVVYNSGFVQIGTNEQREYLKNQISAIRYDDEGTDIGLALLSAVEYLKVSGDPSKKSLVVLFTDGYTQDLINGKTVAESDQELQQALNLALETGCKICVIGTNYNSSMKQNGCEALSGIRDFQVANGVSNDQQELLTIIDAKNQDGMKEVVDVFEKIYAAIGSRIIHTGDIVIETPNVTEVNIIITAPDGISSAVLNSPSGNSASLDLQGAETQLDGARLIYKEGKAYQLIKMVEPIEMGTWLLNVMDKQSQPIINYSWMLTTKTEIAMQLERQQVSTVLATVTMTNGEAHTEADFFNALTEQYLTITDPSGASSREELVYDGAGSLTAMFHPEQVGEYTVTAKVTDGYFSRSCTGKITVTEQWLEEDATESEELGSETPTEHQAQPQREPWDFGTVTVWNWFSTEADLAKQTEVDLLRCKSVSGEGELAEITLDGTVMQIRGLRPGTTDLTVLGRTADGRELELTGKLHVRNTLIPVLMLAVLLAFGALLLFIRSRRSMRGRFSRVSVQLIGGGSETVPELGLLPARRKLSMLDVVQKYSRDLLNTNWQQTVRTQMLSSGGQYYSELKKTKLLVNADRTSFTVKGKGKRTTFSRGGNSLFWNSKDGKLSISLSYEQH